MDAHVWNYLNLKLVWFWFENHRENKILKTLEISEKGKRKAAQPPPFTGLLAHLARERARLSPFPPALAVR
jgi:hypothetical protein